MTAAAVAKDDDSDIALPESVPTRRTIATTSAGSSESPSSDEMVVGAKSASAAAARAGPHCTPPLRRCAIGVPMFRHWRDMVVFAAQATSPQIQHTPRCHSDEGPGDRPADVHALAQDGVQRSGVAAARAERERPSARGELRV